MFMEREIDITSKLDEAVEVIEGIRNRLNRSESESDLWQLNWKCKEVISCMSDVQERLFFEHLSRVKLEKMEKGGQDEDYRV